MGNWISYTVASSLILCILYIAYKILLSREKQPALNRLVIMGSFLVAAVSPVINFPTSYPAENGNVIIDQLMIAGTHSSTPYALPPLNISLFKALVFVYFGGVGITLIITVFSLAKTFSIIRNGHKINVDGHSIIVIDRCIIPFSIFNIAVISVADYNSPAKNSILTHEFAHIKYKHSYDLIVATMFCILLWYNPAVWRMTAELRANHEYEADTEVLKSGLSKREYQYTLLKKAIGRSFPVLANSLNHSNLKKRITMMQKSNSSKSRRARVLALIPAAILGLAVINTPLVSNALERLSNSGMDIVLNHKGSENSALNNRLDNEATTTPDRKVVKTAEVMPKYPGGEQAMFKFLIDNMKFPESEMDRPAGRYNVVVSFIVDTDGKIDEIEIVRSQGEGFDNEAKRVVSLFPKFTPGTVGGKPVAVSYTLPVVFSLSEKDKAKK